LGPLNDQEKVLDETLQPGSGFFIGSNTPKFKTTSQRNQSLTDTYINNFVEIIGNKIIEILQTPLPNSQVEKKEKKPQKIFKPRNKRKRRNAIDNMEENPKVIIRRGIKRLKLNCRGESRLPIMAKPVFRFIRQTLNHL